MTIISKKIRYVSHDLNTRFHACKTYSNKTFSVIIYHTIIQLFLRQQNI